MAGFNPFKKFRVYQRYALALLGIMAIISFIILPTLLMNFDGQSGQAASLIAKCRRPGYGNIDYNRLTILQQNRVCLRSFYSELTNILSKQVAPSDQMRLFPLQRLAYTYGGPISETALVENWLLARYAHDKGFVITDKLVSEFLNTITDNTINAASMQVVCDSIGIPEEQIIYVLKEELLTAHIRNVFLQSTVPVTPVSRWDYYQRIRRSLAAEVAVVPVEEFVKNVPAPSDSELEAFFEANKNNVYDPALPESGFAIPKKIAFEVIDTTPSDELLDSITQEEIEAYYEENKDKFFRNDSGLLPSQGGQMPDLMGPGLPGMNQGSSIFQNLQPQGGDQPSGDFQSDYLNSPTDLPGPGLNAPVETPVAPANEQPEVTPSTDEQTRIDVSGVYRNVVFQQEGEEPVATEEPKADEPAPTEEPKTEESAPTEEPKTEELAPTEEPKTEESVPVEEPKTEESVPVEEPKTEEPAPAEEPKTEESAPIEEPITDEPIAGDGINDDELKPTENAATTDPVDTSILFQPLSSVENLIRQILANQKIDNSTTEISKQMREYFTNSYISASTVTKPNLAILAAEHKLKLISVTTPISIYEAQKQDYWQSNSVRTFLYRVFYETPPNFEPLVGREDRGMQVQDFSDLAYIGWISSSSSQMTPLFSDEGMKETVKKRWIEVHARKLAMEKAKEYAEIANKSKDKSLNESLANANLKIVDTERFSWFAQSYAAAGYGRADITFGEVCERGVPKGSADFGNKLIQAPGSPFMETAYSLQVGETGVAFNQPEMVAFVIRVTESAPADDLLWRFFAVASPGDYLGAGKDNSQREQYMAWIKQIEKSVGFEWVNRPDENRGEN